MTPSGNIYTKTPPHFLVGFHPGFNMLCTIRDMSGRMHGLVYSVFSMFLGKNPWHSKGIRFLTSF